MLWMVPSFYGDLRLESTGPKECRLVVKQATMQEKAALEKLAETARKKGWVDNVQGLVDGVTLKVPVEKAGKVLAKALKPGRKLVSAIRISGGKIEEVTEQTFERALVKAGDPYRTEEVRAVTVAEPVRGCPAPDFNQADVLAREVLDCFLSDEQRADFNKYNRFVTVGGTTGHRYMVTSRHERSALAKYGGRSLYDLDENRAICTHDWSVPAAEEVLALHLFVSMPGYEGWLRTLPE